MLMIAKYIIFPRFGRMDIERPEKYGGNVSYDSYEALTEAYFSGALGPVDLKSGVAEGINKVLAPVNEFFTAHPENYDKVVEILKGLGKLRRKQIKKFITRRVPPASLFPLPSSS
jgi:tyrosyl-tRNA synthetase